MKLKIWLSSFFILFTFPFLWAQEWALCLEDLKMISQTDTFGDQVYFFVLQKNDSQPVAYSSLPSFPFSYTQINLQDFQPGILWQGNVHRDEHLSLVISLVEREAMPWIADEVLGVIESAIAQDEKGIQFQWNVLSPSVTLEQNYHEDGPFTQRAHVEQNGGEYTFALTWKPVEE